MKKQKLYFEELKLYTLDSIKRYAKRMKTLARKNGDLDVLEDFWRIERGIEVAEDFILDRISEFEKMIGKNQNGWNEAIIILKGMVKDTYGKKRKK
jgi:hypothetical protein